MNNYSLKAFADNQFNIINLNNINQMLTKFIILILLHHNITNNIYIRFDRNGIFKCLLLFVRLNDLFIILILLN